MADSPFDGLKPTLLWKHFESFTRIPRCSGNEAAAGEFVLRWAADHDFKSSQDPLGNIVVRVPASEGREGAPAVALQGHLDMVGEKDSASPHDFATDPLKVIREGDWITADGTTLGADNGVGLAACMAAAEDPEVIHGPLELLFTVDEETGLTGATGLEPGFVTAKTLLNLDSEEEGAVYVGCAGGRDSEVALPVERQPGIGSAFKVQVSGLLGGHSGLDINTGRGNALKVLAEYLGRLSAETELELIAFEGGDKHNAIPREALAVVSMPEPARKKAGELAAEMSADLQTIYGKNDPGVKLEILPQQSNGQPLTQASRDALLDLVQVLPHGVLAMSQDVAGLVETSTNLAVVRLEQDHAVLQESSRSSVMPSLKTVQRGIFAAARLAKGQPRSLGGYPGWQPNMDSEVLTRAIGVHQRLFGEAPEVKAIHAGLECGIIGEKYPGMDMISFGPQIEAPHSPSERVKISTLHRFYGFLKGLLADLAASH